MDSLAMASFLIISTLFLLSGLASRLHRRLPYPPGPKGLPMLGNMLTMDQLTHRGLAKLAEEYGALFHLKMCKLHIITVSSPDIARQVLKEQDNIFSNRPANIAVTYLTYNRSDLAFAHYGPFWRQMRKLCAIKLFSRKRAESWASVRDEVDSMIKAVAANNGKMVNIGELIFALSMNITYRAAFGLKNDRKEEFIEIMQDFSKLFGAFNVADFIPWLRWIDPQGLNTKLVKARNALDVFIDKVIDEHLRKRSSQGNANHDHEFDMVDELLAFYFEEAKVIESGELHNSINLTKDNIKAVIMDVMFGGAETVGSSIEWAMSELMESTKDLKQVQQELADVIGLERRVEESDLDKLTFLKCTLKETLRLHPPIPLLLHETAQNTEVAGYYIQAKSRVMINVWAIGRDKNSWEEPHSFSPSRFLKLGVPDYKGSNFEYIPFGSGRRSCPGMQLGYYALELAVAHLLHCFTWELPDGMKPSEVDKSDVFGFAAARATRLEAVPKLRLVCPI